MSAWTGKPCVGCDRKKGPKHADLKFCHRCKPAVERANRELSHRRRAHRNYGVSPADQLAVLEAQGGLCPICERANGRSRRLSLDHDHVTGFFRGYVCGLCNDMLGHARDKIDFFERAIGYLREPPARRLGVEVPSWPVESAVDGRTGENGG